MPVRSMTLTTLLPRISRTAEFQMPVRSMTLTTLLEADTPITPDFLRTFGFRV